MDRMSSDRFENSHRGQVQLSRPVLMKRQEAELSRDALCAEAFGSER
jgi:hypothetical protein